MRILWLAASCAGVSESLLHLVEACPGCFRPKEEPSASSLNQHFSEEALDALGDRIASVGGAEALPIFEHLLASCPECAKRGQRVVSQLRRQAGADWSSDRMKNLGLEFSERIGTWKTRASAEKTDAPELLAQLKGQPQARRLMIVRNSRRFNTWPLVDLLCEESRGASAEDAVEAIDLAKIAVEVAENLEEEQYGASIGADIAARAWAFLGNAQRVAGRLDSARTSFERSEAYLEQGSGIDGARAEMLSLRAALDLDSRRLTDARASLTQAQEIYRALGDSHMQGHMLLLLALVDQEEGEAEAAASRLRAAAQLTDADRAPRVVFAVQQNLVLALADLERYEEAEAQLASTWEICRSIGSRIDKLRLRWTEARIDFGLGRLHRAEISLTEVKEAFKSLDMPYDAALAGLELALLYSQQGRAREVKLLALEMLPVFARNEIHREAMAAMTLFAKAAAVEEVTREIVEKALGSLREAASRQ